MGWEDGLGKVKIMIMMHQQQQLQRHQILEVIILHMDRVVAHMEHMEIQDFRICCLPVFFIEFSEFHGIPEIWEGLRKIPGGGTLHSDRFWACTELYGPNSFRCL